MSLAENVHHQGGDVDLAQDAEGVESPLAADQHVTRIANVSGPLSHGNGLFEADGADALDDLLKDLHVAVTGVEDLDPVDRYECDGLEVTLIMLASVARRYMYDTSVHARSAVK
jgi:hypothetical protein